MFIKPLSGGCNCYNSFNLPLVYDSAMSWIETISILNAKISEMINEVNSATGKINPLTYLIRGGELSGNYEVRFSKNRISIDEGANDILIMNGEQYKYDEGEGIVPLENSVYFITSVLDRENMHFKFRIATDYNKDDYICAILLTGDDGLVKWVYNAIPFTYTDRSDVDEPINYEPLNGQFEMLGDTVREQIQKIVSDIVAVNNRITALDTRVTKNESDIKGINTAITAINIRLNGVDTSISTINSTLNTHTNKLTSLETTLNSISNSLNTLATNFNDFETEVNSKFADYEKRMIQVETKTAPRAHAYNTVTDNMFAPFIVQFSKDFIKFDSNASESLHLNGVGYHYVNSLSNQIIAPKENTTYYVNVVVDTDNVWFHFEIGFATSSKNLVGAIIRTDSEGLVSWVYNMIPLIYEYQPLGDWVKYYPLINQYEKLGETVHEKIAESAKSKAVTPFINTANNLSRGGIFGINCTDSNLSVTPFTSANVCVDNKVYVVKSGTGNKLTPLAGSRYSFWLDLEPDTNTAYINIVEGMTRDTGLIFGWIKLMPSSPPLDVENIYCIYPYTFNTNWNITGSLIRSATGTPFALHTNKVLGSVLADMTQTSSALTSKNYSPSAYLFAGGGTKTSMDNSIIVQLSDSGLVLVPPSASVYLINSSTSNPASFSGVTLTPVGDRTYYIYGRLIWADSAIVSCTVEIGATTPAIGRVGDVKYVILGMFTINGGAFGHCFVNQPTLFIDKRSGHDERYPVQSNVIEKFGSTINDRITALENGSGSGGGIPSLMAESTSGSRLTYPFKVEIKGGIAKLVNGVNPSMTFNGTQYGVVDNSYKMTTTMSLSNGVFYVVGKLDEGLCLLGLTDDGDYNYSDSILGKFTVGDNPVSGLLEIVDVYINVPFIFEFEEVVKTPVVGQLELYNNLLVDKVNKTAENFSTLAEQFKQNIILTSRKMDVYGLSSYLMDDSIIIQLSDNGLVLVPPIQSHVSVGDRRFNLIRSAELVKYTPPYVVYVKYTFEGTGSAITIWLSPGHPSTSETGKQGILAMFSVDETGAFSQCLCSQSTTFIDVRGGRNDKYYPIPQRIERFSSMLESRVTALENGGGSGGGVHDWFIAAGAGGEHYAALASVLCNFTYSGGALYINPSISSYYKYIVYNGEYIGIEEFSQIVIGSLNRTPIYCVIPKTGKARITLTKGGADETSIMIAWTHGVTMPSVTRCLWIGNIYCTVDGNNVQMNSMRVFN